MPADQPTTGAAAATAPEMPARVVDTAPTTAPKLADTRSWVVSETTSPIDYSPLITAVIRTTAGTGTLAIRCRGQRTELSVHSEGAWRSSRSGDIQVAYQINEQPPVRLVWAESADGKTASYKDDAADLVRSMPEGARLKISVFDNVDSGHDAFFELTGLDAIRKRIGAVCKTPARRISSGKP